MQGEGNLGLTPISDEVLEAASSPHHYKCHKAGPGPPTPQVLGQHTAGTQSVLVQYKKGLGAGTTTVKSFFPRMLASPW